MEWKISPAFPRSKEQNAAQDRHITRRNLFKVTCGRTFCLKEFGLEKSSRLWLEEKERRQCRREGGREGESPHMLLGHQGQSFCAVSLEHETYSVDYESTVS